MTGNERVDDLIGSWLQDTAPAQLPQRVLTATFAQTRRTRQQFDWRAALDRRRMHRSRITIAAAGAAVVMIVVAGSLGLSVVLNPQTPGASPSPELPTEAPSTAPHPTVDLGIFEPIAGWIVFGNTQGIWGDDPVGPDVRLSAVAGEPLAWSRDGTQLLVKREGRLFNLRADGSEIQLRADSPGVGDATFTPDGLRVVFQDSAALYAVDAEGGPTEFLVALQDARDVGFSPDGKRVAYVTWGSGDSNHRVWVMDLDGNNRHLIVANDVTVGGGHLHGLAWSPAGDRIALGLEGNIYTFAPDGSGFRLEIPDSGRLAPFWSPDGTRLETKGPRHPGGSVGPLASLSPMPPPTASPPLATDVADLLNGFLQARVSGAGAEQFLTNPDDVTFGDVPLLYETSAKARYDRGEFEQVLGVTWPYELTGFKLRLFAGTTLVEQLVFVSHLDDRLGLEYAPDGFGTAIAPTTEDGVPVARPFVAFGGEVTLDVAHPWVFRMDGGSINLVPQSARPTTDGGERSTWGELRLVADPSPIGTPCQANPDGCDARALAQGLRSSFVFETTDPEPFSDPASWYMEVAGRSVLGIQVGADQRMALYLYDAPAGSSMRLLVVAVVVDASEFEHAGVALGPIPYSIQFHGPRGTQ